MCLGSSEFFAGIKFSKWMREDFIFLEESGDTIKVDSSFMNFLNLM